MLSVLAAVAGLSSAGLVVAVVLLILQGRDRDQDGRIAVAAMKASWTAQREAERLQRSAEEDRDEEKAGRLKAEAELAAALKQDAAVQNQRNALMEREADDAARDVAAAPDGAGALSRLNLVLGSVPKLPAVPAAGDGGGGATAGADHGHAGQDAVPAAGPSEAAGAGRRS